MDDFAGIRLTSIGKKFKRWIFKEVDCHLIKGRWYGLVGRNGIGKSTLLSIISGYATATTGQVEYLADSDRAISKDQWPSLISYAAPYIELIEEFTVTEMIRFHFKFSQSLLETDMEKIIDEMQLGTHSQVLVSDLSSGLGQRLQLGLAFLTEKPILLLDEPTSYLDNAGKSWFHDMMQTYAGHKLVVIATNDQEDLVHCQDLIDVSDFIVS